MKHLNISILCLLVILFFACDQHFEMSTQINRDGSCLRQVALQTHDSAFLTGDSTRNPFPFQLTPQWQVTVYDSLTATSQTWPLSHWPLLPESSAVTVIASQFFSSVEDLNNNFRFDHSSWKNIKPEITLKKSFRWFYTYYTFTEKYKQIPPDVLPVPLSQYLTQQEQNLWFQDNPSTFQGMNGHEIYDYLNATQEKVEKWWNNNLFLLQYNTFQEFLASQGDHPYATRMKQAQDSIFNPDKNNGDFLVNNFTSVIDQYFQTTYFTTQYHQHQPEIDSLFEAKFKITELFDPQIKYSLLLPGEIISTNAPYSDHNQLLWKVDAYRFLPGDYILTAQSRKINYWAVILTFLFAGSILYNLFRPHRRNR